MAITAKLVAELRKRTGAGMMDCKKALQETHGDLEQAVDHLRKAGIAKADKKAARVAAEGKIIIKSREDKHAIVMAEINSETDFAAKDASFGAFCDKVVDIALQNKCGDLSELMNLTYDGGATVEDARKNLVATIGENVNVRRIIYRESTGTLGQYVHGGRIGVLIELEGGDGALAKDLAMHIAANNPQAISSDDVPEELITREKEIFSAQAKESGKPDEIIEKMITGRINKFLDEISLLGQPFVKDPNTKISQILKQQQAQVKAFDRYQLGEGIEKETVDFAEEVMATAKLSSE